MRTIDPKYIVQDEFIHVNGGGVESIITARIGTPYFQDAKWRCAATLDGVDGRYPDRHGVNGAQCLSLAIALIFHRLIDLMEGGGSLYFPTDRSVAIDLDALKSVFGQDFP